MRKAAILSVGCLMLAFVVGCAKNASDVSESGALDKYDEMKKATESTVSKEEIDKSRN